MRSPILQDRLRGPMPRFDLGMRHQSTTKDESGERQYGEPFTERDPKREVRNVTGPGEQEEVHSHDRDPLMAATATTASPTKGLITTAVSTTNSPRRSRGYPEIPRWPDR